MPRRAVEPSKKSVSLRIASSFTVAWESVLWPWFEKVSPGTWESPLPSLVLVPTRAQANDLKRRLIDKRLSHLGLHFVTPAGLRTLLGREDLSPAAKPEHLRLILAVAATEMENDPNELEALAAKSVARSPTPLLRALDRLAIADWKFDQLGMSSFSPLVERFKQLCEKCGFILTGEADRRRLQQAKQKEPEFSNLLVSGFDGSHWPEWFLLRTAVELAEHATVLLEEPRGDLFDVDLCWVGSWEEAYGEAQRATDLVQGFGESLFTESEMRGGVEENKHFDFLIGTNISEQAQAIAWQCVRYLADDKCKQVGVIFPRGGALSRLVSDALARLDIPHNDGPAHIVPGTFESAEWQAWLELQRSPRLNSFLHFLNELPDAAILSSKISRQSFENILRETYSELLLDDLQILGEFCARHTSEKFRSVGEALRGFPFLAGRATLEQFLKQTQDALESLGWKQQMLEIAGLTRNWPRLLEVEFSRALFLRWLDETAVAFGASRSAAGDHPYARVQLLTVAQAQHQNWSHLIFAGWNEGAWPPAAGMEFARVEEIRSFNRSVQQLNKRASRQGSQGEGHLTVRENHSLYLGPNEQRGIALRQFDAVLESASEAVTVAASLLQEDAPERFWNPSECLTRLFFKTRGEPLSQMMLKDLQRATAQFVNDAQDLVQKSGSPPDFQQTLAAFDARRDPTKAAGEYDFALRGDGYDRPAPALSVSDFERMVSAPAIIWMKRYLTVEAPEDPANPWASSTGKWVHRWLADVSEPKEGNLFSIFPSAAKIDERVRHSADQLRLSVEQLCGSLDKILPDWWKSGLLNAQFLARHLGNKIARAEGWTWMATELPIGRDGPVKLTESIQLNLRGQIDLVLAENDARNFSGQKIWVVDYKTGSTRELRNTDLHDHLVKGTALQLGLYALAIRQLGAAEVAASILSVMVKNVAPQLSVEDLTAHTDVFSALAEMQRTGVFGMKGEIRPAFRYGVPYPLATLPIDTDILEEKWALTHPALVLEKEEWETW